MPGAGTMGTLAAGTIEPGVVRRRLRGCFQASTCWLCILTRTGAIMIHLTISHPAHLCVSVGEASKNIVRASHPSRVFAKFRQCSLPAAVCPLSRQGASAIVSCSFGADEGSRAHGKIVVCVASAVWHSLAIWHPQWRVLVVGLHAVFCCSGRSGLGVCQFQCATLIGQVSVRADVSCGLTLPVRLVAGVTTDAKDKLPGAEGLGTDHAWLARSKQL
ncbi:hypothetical protein QBC39DRAFT_116816 [Podospora conica]|nr:hypothetical protein QBC39DRAFT_116816 [Schizothecium conicum]